MERAKAILGTFEPLHLDLHEASGAAVAAK